MPSPPLPEPAQAAGILVAGTHPRCGKTVACGGIAGAMHGLGFKLQAIKPFDFEPRVSLRPAHDQAFFDRVLPPLQPVTPFSVESPFEVSPSHWHRWLETCRGMAYPYLLETPGSVASPLRFEADEALDAVDLAMALNIPLLLVSGKDPDVVGQLAPVLTYLWHRDAPVLGWLAVETAPVHPAHWEEAVLHLSHRYTVPYLGEIAYSPSISVEALQQGNIIRTTESGVDLLPVQQALGVTVP